MNLPHSAQELAAIKEEDLPAVLFQMLVATAGTQPEHRRKLVELNDAFHHFSGSVTVNSLHEPLRTRVCDAFHELCVRDFVWFNPHAYGYTHGHYEFTAKGRTATAEEIASPWYSSSATVLERFPEHVTWDETMGAYFRMAVATHQARVCEAALFLVGGAAERLIGVVEERLEHLLRDRRKKAGERLAAIVDLFEREGDHDTAELLGIVGNVARWSRNEVGHPKPEPPDVDEAMVAARIWEFPGYVSRVIRAAEALAAR